MEEGATGSLTTADGTDSQWLTLCFHGECARFHGDLVCIRTLLFAGNPSTIPSPSLAPSLPPSSLPPPLLPPSLAPSLLPPSLLHPPLLPPSSLAPSLLLPLHLPPSLSQVCLDHGGLHRLLLQRTQKRLLSITTVPSHSEDGHPICSRHLVG